ncbi:hypothetical protein FXO37_35948 [Capsicum annuum]|nr:hypothetical protein FXO37_35948 [Capsicum annuum]
MLSSYNCTFVSTRSIGKGPEEGLKNFTMSSSQGMRILCKNSMVHENEYMKVHTPLSPSTNQVKQRTKDVEKVLLGKEQKKDLRTLPCLLFKERERCVLLGRDRKEDLKILLCLLVNEWEWVFKNNVESNKGMRSMENNSLILEKENMQNNVALPPSIDQDKFESDNINDYRGRIFGWMNEFWNKWRGHLHSKYVKNKSMVRDLKLKPERIEKKDWE